MAFAEDRELLVALCKEMLVYLGDNPYYCETWLRVMRAANKAAPVAAALALEAPVVIKVCAAQRCVLAEEAPASGGGELWNIEVTFKGPYGDCGTYHLFQHAINDSDPSTATYPVEEGGGVHWRAQANVVRVLRQWLRRLLLLQPLSDLVASSPRAVPRRTAPSAATAAAKDQIRGVRYPPDRLRRRAHLLREGNPNLQERDLIARIAADYGCCQRTVRNALKDSAPELAMQQSYTA
jgi:hypothetical protein